MKPLNLKNGEQRQFKADVMRSATTILSTKMSKRDMIKVRGSVMTPDSTFFNQTANHGTLSRSGMLKSQILARQS